MYGFISNLLKKVDFINDTEFLATILTIACMLVLCLVLFLIVKFIVTKVALTVTKKTKYEWDDILYKNKFFTRIANLVIPIIIYRVSATLPPKYSFINKVATMIFILVFMILMDALLNSIDDIYRMYEISKIRPIRGFLQVIKVALYIICGICIIALLLDKSPMVLLGSIGAMTAVISLIFKDVILGFVAGIRLTGSDMIRIGDWIEVPKHNADGTVIDISMTAVTVQNFDKTITLLPAYALVSGSFINWRGMTSTGARRIKRAIYIDSAYIKICDEDMMQRFKKIDLLKEYLEAKLLEMKQYNKGNLVDDAVNARKVTNIGTFRAYILEYLKQHSGIHKDMPIMVRQLAPDDKGLPLEIYAFTNTIVWAEYEKIQSDIFDHIYAVVSEFGLYIYQQPSGKDIRELKESDSNK